MRLGSDLEGRAKLHSKKWKTYKPAAVYKDLCTYHDFTKRPGAQDLVNLIMLLLLERRRLWQQRLGQGEGFHAMERSELQEDGITTVVNPRRSVWVEPGGKRKRQGAEDERKRKAVQELEASEEWVHVSTLSA